VMAAAPAHGWKAAARKSPTRPLSKRDRAQASRRGVKKGDSMFEQNIRRRKDKEELDRHGRFHRQSVLMLFGFIAR